jgi:hypothetical protein
VSLANHIPSAAETAEVVVRLRCMHFDKVAEAVIEVGQLTSLGSRSAENIPKQ